MGRPNNKVETGKGVKPFTSWPVEWREGGRKGGRKERGEEERGRVGGRGREEETRAEKKGQDLKVPFLGMHSVIPSPTKPTPATTTA